MSVRSKTLANKMDFRRCENRGREIAMGCSSYSAEL